MSIFTRIVPAGDSAVLIELGSEIDPMINDQVYSLASSISKEKITAVIELIPSYRSLLVSYDPLIAGYAEMQEMMSEIIDRSLDSVEGVAVEAKIIELPVVYGGEDGPDIEAVAEHSGVSVQDVIDIHSGVDYRVYMIGFAPGFPYLGGLDERIAAPRLKTPRLIVPAGAVGIAESQTGVYPNASPGGWQLIGRTAIRLFDVNRTTPSLITQGAKVRFVPVNSHD
tara:strand:- start:778 stop:1452 length:675 start_codon:yes stop_codon:yes gene_type:complete